MLHEPAQVSGKDPAAAFKTRLGVCMFFLYAVVYAGFVWINVATPKAMESIVFSGLNLAVVYGIGLIVYALLLALIYERLCSLHEQKLNKDNREGGN